MPREDEGGDWADGATRQGMPRISSHLRKLKEARKDPPPKLMQGAQLCGTLISDS